MWFASQNPYPIYDQNLRFSLPFYDQTKIDTLIMTVALIQLPLNVIFEWLLFMVASMTKK